MSETLYRIADRDALERLYASGARVLHRFPHAVVLAAPLARPIAGVTAIDPRTLAIPAHPRADELGELAFAIRHSDAHRARRARRPHVGADIGDILARRLR